MYVMLSQSFKAKICIVCQIDAEVRTVVYYKITDNIIAAVAGNDFDKKRTEVQLPTYCLFVVLEVDCC